MASDKIFCLAEGVGSEDSSGCRYFSPSTDPAGTFPNALTAGESCSITVRYTNTDGNQQYWHWSSLARYIEAFGFPEEMHPNAAIAGILYLGNETLIRALMAGTEVVVDEDHPPFALIAPGGSITLNGVQLVWEAESEPCFVYLPEYMGAEITVIAANNEIMLKDVASNARSYGRYNAIAIPTGINTESGLQPGEDLQYHKGAVVDSWNQLTPIFMEDSTEDAWGRPGAVLDLTEDKWRLGGDLTGAALVIPPGTMINQSLTIIANPPGIDIATYFLNHVPMEFTVATESNQPFAALVGCDMGTYDDLVRLSPYVGATVNVLFEAQTYSCTFKTGTVEGNTVYYLGNGTALGLEGNDEPFLSIDMDAWTNSLNYVLDGSHAGARFISMWTNKEVVHALLPLEITANGTYAPDPGFGLGEVTVNVPSGGVETVTTAEEMDAKLVAENIGNAYLYTGTATEFYATGDFYIVEEDS